MTHHARYVYTIKQADIGALFLGPMRLYVPSFIGRVLPCDVGKRVYIVKSDDGLRDVPQIESEAQREESLS